MGESTPLALPVRLIRSPVKEEETEAGYRSGMGSAPGEEGDG